MSIIQSEEDLRALYGQAKPVSVRKEIRRLDHYCRDFIALSPFVVLSTIGKDGLTDCSPRGDAPGFVEVESDEAVLIPDRRGNGRIDTLTNIVSNPSVSLLFLVPGMDETFRINGEAEIDATPDLCARFAIGGKVPKTVLRVRVKQAYMQCAKALMRSKLWSGDYAIDRSSFPSMGEMMKAHAQHEGPAETREQMLKRYKDIMY